MKYLILLASVFLLTTCERPSKEAGQNLSLADEGWIERENIHLDTLPDEALTEFQVCDIIVKPNLNWLPGTTAVPFGHGFGHVSMVIQAARDTSEALLLAKVMTIESQARDVPAPYQVRKVAAFIPGGDYSYANFNFNPANLGRYYRLRMDLTSVQKQALVDYLLDRENDLSSSRALKKFPGKQEPHNAPADEEAMSYWYCSLIIWQAFYDVLGIDLDANQGFLVYPNDLVNSHHFDQEPGKMLKRVRF